MQSLKPKCTTPSSGARWKPSFVRMLCTAIASMTMLGCASSTMPSAAGPDPLVIAMCPELTPLTDPSFGATTMKLVENAGIYNGCRNAALAGQKATPYNGKK